MGRRKGKKICMGWKEKGSGMEWKVKCMGVGKITASGKNGDGCRACMGRK